MAKTQHEKDDRRRAFQKRLYQYVLRLLKFLAALPNTPVLREMIRQLVRSGTSIGANYFEAQGASSRKDYQNFFAHALKSANESKFWLSVLLDSGFVPESLREDGVWLLQETSELANIFASSIITLKGKR